MNRELMQELVEYKDKQKASQAKRNSFEYEWISYTKENGFDESAERWIFSGFEYRKMHPFVAVLKEIENKKDVIQKLLNGKSFSKNKPKSFKMTLNLFAIMIKELPEETDCVAMLVRRLPSVSMGNDKHRNPEIGKVFNKYLIPDLRTITGFPDLAGLRVKPVVMEEFKLMMKDGISTCKLTHDLTVDELTIVERIEQWLFTNVSEISSDEIQNLPVTTDKNRSVSEVSDESGRQEIEQFDSKPIQPVIDSRETEVGWKKDIQRISSYIDQQEKTQRKLEQRINAATQAEIRALAENARVRESLKRSEENADKLSARNSELLIELSQKVKEITRLTELIAEKEKEVEDHRKLMEIVSKDKSKQSDETLKRLSSELSTYYGDFKSAKEMEMTASLGDVLKDQLNDIYTILEKNGFRFD